MIKIKKMKTRAERSFQGWEHGIIIPRRLLLKNWLIPSKFHSMIAYQMFVRSAFAQEFLWKTGVVTIDVWISQIRLKEF